MNTPQRIFRTCCIVLLTLVMTALQVLSAQSKKHFTAKDIPAIVKTSFEKTYPHAVIKGVGKENENGEVMFEIESMDGSVRRDILFKKDGTIYEVETTIRSSELPRSVQSSIHKKFPGYTVIRAESTIHAADSSYEVLLKKRNKKYEVVLDTHGKITERKYIRSKKGKTTEKEESDEEEND